MENNNFDFINKTYIEGKSPKPIIRIITKVLLVVLILTLLLCIWVDGFSIKLITDNLIVFVFIAYVMQRTKPSNGYRDIVSNFKWDNDRIIITNKDIFKDDNMGKRNEEISINYSNITKLEYSNSLKALNIQGYSVEKTIYTENDNKIVFNNKENGKEEKRNIIYISGKEKEKVINILKDMTKLNVIYLE